MGYHLGARHCILPLLAIVFLINGCSGASTYDYLVSQLRPQLRGGGPIPRRPTHHHGSRPHRPRPPIRHFKGGKGKSNDTEGRFVSVGAETGQNSTYIIQTEGIYEEGERNKTAESIYSEKHNTITPSITIGDVQGGVQIGFHQTDDRTISFGGHPAQNSSTSSNTVSFQPILNIVPLPAPPPQAPPFSWFPPPNKYKPLFELPQIGGNHNPWLPDFLGG